MTYYVIERRGRTLFPTANSQRRCYNGAFHSNDWEEGWTRWERFESRLTKEEAEERLKFWEELSAYAVKSRGSQAAAQHRVKVDDAYNGT